MSIRDCHSDNVQTYKYTHKHKHKHTKEYNYKAYRVLCNFQAQPEGCPSTSSYSTTGYLLIQEGFMIVRDHSWEHGVSKA